LLVPKSAGSKLGVRHIRKEKGRGVLMPTNFQTATVVFPASTGGPKFQIGSATFTGPGAIVAADVALKGFDIFFTNGNHPLLQETVSIILLGVTGLTVTFAVQFGLRDSSGVFDDPFGGSVTVLAVADIV